jgi:hypothetical protein
MLPNPSQWHVEMGYESKNRCFRCALPGLVATAVVIAAGCNSAPPLPQTYSATGTVVYLGEQPMKGGSIQFSLADEPLMRVVSEIGVDGTFTLRTVKDNSNAAGAPEGEYVVTVQPPSADDSRGGIQGGHKGVPSIALTKKYKVEAKQNTFKIVLPVAQPK